MPLPERDLSPRRSPGDGAHALREHAVEVLLGPSLAHVVALVAWRQDDQVVVAGADGRSALAPDGTTTVLAGRDPVADQDPFSDATDAYPYAAVRLHSLFRDARAPDLAVVRRGDHHLGALGDHGSLNGVQSRAPLLLSGTGVRARGVVDRVARTVDVGATLAHLCGAAHEDMDGRPLDLVAPGARHVVGLLWDGAPSADLLAMAEAGELPAVARLLERGCALRGGAIAEFPSVTLVNHTCALTGVGPGRHGIVHNAYFDRATGTSAAPNSAGSWHRAMDFLRPGVTTVFERVAAADPSALTACVDDPVDTGAGYSTFALVRQSEGGTAALSASLPDPEQDPLATQGTGSADYRWGSQIDAVGLEQVLGLWREGDPPRLMWWNTTLTDGAHHAGGPASELARAGLRDSDRRLGAWLDQVTGRGLLDDVVVLLTADHGMQRTDPAVTGDWGPALSAAGIAFRDEAHGFLYLGEDAARA